MNNPQTLTITLATEAAELVQAAVDSGSFANASEAITAALRLWKNQEEDWLLGYTTDELRTLGDEGEASGPGRMTLIDIKREGLRRAGVSNAET